MRKPLERVVELVRPRVRLSVCILATFPCWGTHPPLDLTLFEPDHRIIALSPVLLERVPTPFFFLCDVLPFPPSISSRNAFLR